jgi:hypothetical protein
MDSIYTYEKDGPSVKPELLLRFVTQRLDERLQTDCSKMSDTLKALSLCCVAHDREANEEMNELFFPTTLVKKCRDILGRVSVRPDTEPLDSFQEIPFRNLSEKDSRQILFSAMREIKEVVCNNDFEFAPIIKVLGWIALQPYPRRLQEFEAVWESGVDPAEMMQAARNVLWSAFRHKDAEPW